MSALPEGTWDRAARVYARQERLEHQAIDAALQVLRPRAGERLLDVATGTGIVLRRLASRGGRPARATGLDASAAMLERVGPLPAGWSTVLGDATALPLPDASVEVACCAYLLHVLDDAARKAALRELRRVLVPGGRLVVVTVWSPRAPVRGALAGAAALAPASLGGLRPLDAREALTGWGVERARVVRRGYPSLVVLARRV